MNSDHSLTITTVFKTTFSLHLTCNIFSNKCFISPLYIKMSVFNVTAYTVLVFSFHSKLMQTVTLSRKACFCTIYLRTFMAHVYFVDLFITVTHTEVVLLYYLCLTEIKVRITEGCDGNTLTNSIFVISTI